MILYDAHLAIIGWTGEKSVSEAAGVPDGNRSVQAIRLVAKNNDDHIYYQVFYTGKGWSHPMADGEICGTVGQSKKIDGFKIWGNWHNSGLRLEYRAYADGWTDWHPSGYSLICNKDIKAYEVRFVPADAPTQCASTRIGDPIIDRLNSLASLRGAQSYLEIGVRDGHTFHHINVRHKTGVDPRFQFNIDEYITQPETKLLAMTSDDFFHSIGGGDSLTGETRFDLVYIDGLHKWDQALADLMNSLPYTNEKTIWVMDDASPCDPWSAEGNQGRSYKYRKLARVAGTPWHGDVYKAIFAIHDSLPWISYATVINDGNPQTILWRTSKAAQRKRLFNEPISYAHIGYFDHLDNYHIFNPIPSNKLLEYVGRSFNDDPFHPEITVEDFFYRKVPSLK